MNSHFILPTSGKISEATKKHFPITLELLSELLNSSHRCTCDNTYCHSRAFASQAGTLGHISAPRLHLTRLKCCLLLFLCVASPPQKLPHLPQAPNPIFPSNYPGFKHTMWLFWTGKRLLQQIKCFAEAHSSKQNRSYWYLQDVLPLFPYLSSSEFGMWSFYSYILSLTWSVRKSYQQQSSSFCNCQPRLAGGFPGWLQTTIRCSMPHNRYDSLRDYKPTQEIRFSQ